VSVKLNSRSEKEKRAKTQMTTTETGDAQCQLSGEETIVETGRG